jgi:hypothetical protein
MEKYDSTEDTLAHQNLVAKYIFKIIHELSERAFDHDTSKLEPPEKECFDRVTPLLKDLTYGSDKYKETLSSMKEALDHHYANNRHHPEHFEHGISDMNLVDIVEMLCDWFAASQRHKDGSIRVSILRNADRFNYDGRLVSIFTNTIDFLEDQHGRFE